MDKLNQVLIKEYGIEKGLRIATVVIPNLINDFRKSLNNAPRGVVIKEIYRFEDIDGCIEFTGIRQMGRADIGTIKSVSVNGTNIDVDLAL